MNQRDFFLQKARRSVVEVDWNAYRWLQNQVSNKIRNEKRCYNRNEIQEILDRPKALWKTIKNVFPSKKAIPESIKTEEGHTITDQSTIAKEFNNFFTNAFAKLVETAQEPIGTCKFSGDNFKDQILCLLPATESFVFKQLKGLKVKKATGLDRIPACLLKDSAAVITQTITFFDHTLFDHRHCTRWVEAGRSCSSTQIRWTESYGQLPAYLDPTSYLKNCWKSGQCSTSMSLHQHGILNSFQSGFRQHHSTYTAVAYFCDIRRSTDAGKLTGALFIVLKKAFGTVPCRCGKTNQGLIYRSKKGLWYFPLRWPHLQAQKIWLGGKLSHVVNELPNLWNSCCLCQTWTIQSSACP